MGMKFIIFSRPGCPFCDDAQSLLEKKNKNFKVVNFNLDQAEILKEIQDMYGWKTVPMVFKREKNDIGFIGGHSDLVEFLEKGE